MFTFSDELVHSFNANQIVDHHHLFRPNSILSVTPHYPGLEGATSALMSLTGLSSFGPASIVVGAARLSLVVAMFFLFHRLSGSARVAGLGVAIYTGNFNFLFWGAQYSYESLSLPLLIMIMMALAERESSPRTWAREWGLPIVLGTVAIVVTHHLTSYALVGFIAVLALGHWLLRKSWSWPNPWKFAVLAAVLALAWLLLVANSTFGYLSAPLSEAFEADLQHRLRRGAAARPLPGPRLSDPTDAGPGPGGGTARGADPRRRPALRPAQDLAALSHAAVRPALRPRLARLLRHAGAAPCARSLGDRQPRSASSSSSASPSSSPGPGWRSWRPRGRPWIGRALLAGCLGIVLVGGAISGWPWDTQLARPVRASAEGRTIVSPPLAMAEWAKGQVKGGRFAAPIADARLLLDPGNHIALAGSSPDVEDLVEEHLAGRLGGAAAAQKQLALRGDRPARTRRRRHPRLLLHHRWSRLRRNVPAAKRRRRSSTPFPAQSGSTTTGRSRSTTWKVKSEGPPRPRDRCLGLGALRALSPCSFPGRR